MEQQSLRDKCKINTNFDTDTFVGILYENGDITISFPLGYHLSSDDADLRKDIFLLINTLSKNSDLQKSSMQTQATKYSDTVSFPMQAYLYLIRDFIQNGYYKETESKYVKSKSGKINWSKTIKSQKAYIQGDNAYYLDYITRKNQINMDEIITLIHEFCVYESYEKMGWLFSSSIPPKPRIKFQPKLFLSVLKDKLNSTFNDYNRKLFQNMIAVISWLGDTKAKTKFTFGTYRFEYIWEKMVDNLYGIKDKSKYFPQTTWHIGNSSYKNASLEPDTIMKFDGDIYVLDSKYYKYGETTRLSDLPESTSINKQITYAEYICESGRFDMLNGKTKIYNAFVLPFDAESNKFPGEGNLRYIGYATGDWKTQNNDYEKVIGVLLDVKHLMQCDIENDEEIQKLAELIEKSL